MAPSTAAPFSILYLRPEIASGFYNFPRQKADDDDDSGASAPVDAATTDDSPPLAPPRQVERLPGVPPEEAAFFLTDGQIVHAIRQRLVHSGFVIHTQRTIHFTKSQVRRLAFLQSRDSSSTGSSENEDVRGLFLDRFTRGPSLALLVSLPSREEPDAAVALLQSLVGGPQSDPSQARKDAISASLAVDQWPLRALCGLSAEFPGVYASASLDCAVRERQQLFSETTTAPALPLDTALVALLSTFQNGFPHGIAWLLKQFNLHGVVVTSSIAKPSLTAAETAAIASVELHPSTTSAERETFRSRLHDAIAAAPPATLVLRVVGCHLNATLRQLLGPASVAQAQLLFPDSLRAQLTGSLVSLDGGSTSSSNTIKSKENTATCLETGIFVSFDPVAVPQLVPEDESIDTTFAIIKPNAARDPEIVAQIQHAIKSFGFSIDRQRRLLLTRAQAASFYAEHTGKPFFERLIAFMTSGQIVAMQLSRKQAIPMWRALMGPTNCLVARESHPWTLRARFGIDGTQNATHGSDAPASARRELRFFFGASTMNAPMMETLGPQDAQELFAQRAAVTPLLLPYPKSESLESVLVSGFEEMLGRQKDLATPLEACQWLGEWLLAYSKKHSENDGDSAQTSQSTGSPAKKVAKRRAPRPVAKANRLAAPNGSHKVVAITVDPSLPVAVKETLKETIRGHVERLGYTFVDVGAGVGSSAAAVRIVQKSGKRRVVLFDMTHEMEEAWRQSCGDQWMIGTIVTITTSAQGAVLENSKKDDPFVEQVTLHVPATFTHESSSCSAHLLPLFRDVLDPVVVLIDDDHNHQEDHKISLTTWTQYAVKFGFVLLTFNDLISSEIQRERDPIGVLTQWKRTKSLLPTKNLLDALHRAISDPETVQLAGAAHKFLLFGFPWASFPPLALETTVARITAVLQVGQAMAPPLQEIWSHALLKRGAVHIVAACDKQQRDRVVTSVLAPSVTFVMGSGDVSTVRTTAVQSGLLWIDFNTLPAESVRTVDATIATLRELLVRVDSSHRRFVIYGFPRSVEDAESFLQQVTTPSSVLVVANSDDKPVLSSEVQAIVRVLQRDAAHAVQSFVSPSDHPQRLRQALTHKSVMFAVGDCAALDDTQLRKTLAPFGFTIIDLRGASNHNVATAMVVDAIVSCASPRCLVLDGPSHVDHFRTLQAHFGDALARIFVLKQHKQLPPPKKRNPSENGEDDDNYDSEEEEEKEKQRQKEAAALSPELVQLVQAFTIKGGGHAASSRSPRVEVVSYLAARTAFDQIVAAVTPCIVSILGHPHTVYKDATNSVCLTQQLPFVDLSTKSVDGGHEQQFSQQLARLQADVASCWASTIVVDGFPRAVHCDDGMTSVRPYAAQQIQMMAQSAGRMSALVRFRMSLDMLLDNKAPHITRDDVEDAQDELDDATGDLVAYCGTTTKSSPGGRRPHPAVVEVSCDRELADIHDELTEAIQRLVLL